MSEEKKDDNKKTEVDKKLLENTKLLVSHVDSLNSKDLNYEKKRNAFLMDWEWHSVSSDLMEKLAVPKKTRHEATICQFVDFMVKKKFLKDEKKCIPALKKGRKMTRAKREEMEKCLKKVRQKMKRERAEILRNLSETAPCYRPKKTFVLYNEDYAKNLAYPKRIYLKDILEDFKLLIQQDKKLNDIQTFLKSDKLSEKLKNLLSLLALVNEEEKLAFPNLTNLETLLTDFSVTVEKGKTLKIKTINEIILQCQSFLVNTYRIEPNTRSKFNAFLNDLVQILLKERKTLEIRAIKENMKTVLEQIEDLRVPTLHREKCVHLEVGPPDGKTDDMEALKKSIDKLAEAKSRYLKHVLDDFSFKFEQRIKEQQQKLELKLAAETGEKEQKSLNDKSAYLEHRIERLNFTHLTFEKKRVSEEIKATEIELEKEKKSLENSSENPETPESPETIKAQEEKIQKLEEKLKKLGEQNEKLDIKLEEMGENLKSLENYKQPKRKVRFVSRRKTRKSKKMTAEDFQKKFPRTLEKLANHKEIRLMEAMVGFKDVLLRELKDQTEMLELSVAKLKIQLKNLQKLGEKGDGEKVLITKKIEKTEEKIQKLKEKPGQIEEFWAKNVGKPEVERITKLIESCQTHRKFIYSAFLTSRDDRKKQYIRELRENGNEMKELKKHLKAAKKRARTLAKGPQKLKDLSAQEFDQKYQSTRTILNSNRVQRKLKETLKTFGQQMIQEMERRLEFLEKEKKKSEKDKKNEEDLKKLDQAIGKQKVSIQKMKSRVAELKEDEEKEKGQENKKEKKQLSEEEQKKEKERSDRIMLPKFFSLHDTMQHYKDILNAQDPKSAKETYVAKFQEHLSNLEAIHQIWLETKGHEQRKEFFENAEKEKQRLKASIKDQEWRPADDAEIEKLALPKIPKLEAAYWNFKDYMSQQKRERIENDLKQRKMMKPEYLEELRKQEEQAQQKKEEKRLKHQKNCRRVIGKIQKKIRAELLDEIYGRILKIVPKMVLNRKLPPIMSERFKLLQNSAYTFLLCLNGCPVNQMENNFYLSLASIIAEYIVKTLHTVMNAEKIPTENFVKKSVETKTEKRNKELLEFMKNTGRKC